MMNEQMDGQVQKFLAEYEFKQNQRLIKEFNSLKPTALRSIITFLIYMIALFSAHYFTDDSNFESVYYFFIMAVFISSIYVDAENRRINKRIDALVKLIKTGVINEMEVD